MKEHRGQHRVKIYLKNRENVKDWLENNPDKPMKRCAEELGLSYLTTRKHIGSILNELQVLKEL